MSKMISFLSIISVILSFNTYASNSKTTQLLSARNLPQNNQILFIIGQNSDDLSDYKKEVLDIDPSMPKPGGITLYTSLNVFPESVYNSGTLTRPLNSIKGAGNWGDGEHNLKRSLAEYPGAAVIIGLNMTDNTYGINEVSCAQQPLRGIAATGDEDIKNVTHRYHELVDEMINELQNTGRKIYLRIGYEFDGPWNCYTPEPYKKAFRYIKKRIDELNADNIATVWQSAGYLFDDTSGNHIYSSSTAGHFNMWYPGDDVVDWIGISTFLSDKFETYQIPNAMDFAKQTPRELQNRFLAFARKHNKPVMLAESSPQGYNLNQKFASPILLREEKPMSDKDLWETWYADWFNFIEGNRDVIRAIAYINSDWDASKLWRCDLGAQKTHGQSVMPPPDEPDALSCVGGVYWGDSRLQKNKYILSRFKEEITKDFYMKNTLFQ